MIWFGSLKFICFMIFISNSNFFQLHSKADNLEIARYEKSLCSNTFKIGRAPRNRTDNCPTNGIVSVHKGGRLGNQIFEYASAFVTAHHVGLQAFVPSCILINLKKYFDNLSVPSLNDIGDCTINRKKIVKSYHKWNSTEENIILPRHTITQELIIKYLDDFRQEFTFKKSLSENAQTVLRNAAKSFNIEKPTFVGVHVRRTDYIAYLRRKHKKMPATVNFYLKAMDYFINKYDNVVFIVVSDDIKWCKNNLSNTKYPTIFISDTKAKGIAEDLSISSACNHSIIDYGTYGAFAALLTTGETITFNITNFATTKIAGLLSNWQAMT